MEVTKNKAPSPHVGPALAVTFLLRDYDNYGVSERIRYHLHLSEVLGDSATLLTAAETNKDYSEHSSLVASQKSVDTESKTGSDAGNSTHGRVLRQEAPCGIARVLECVPTLHHNRLTRQQRSFLKTSLVQLNQRLDEVQLPCSEPSRLPLHLNSSTRVSFAYEITRVVLLIDASPSMTATFGVAAMDSSKDTYCCPMDRLPDMTKMLFHSLAEKVPLPFRQGFWQPKLSVSVLAVYPRVRGDPHAARTSILVRDWAVSDAASVETLITHLKGWVLNSVEAEISSRVHLYGDTGDFNFGPSFSEEQSASPTTFLDWWQAGKAALDALTSAARPCIIVATDGRSVSTDRALDGIDDRDIPFFLLDLSSPSRSRNGHGTTGARSMMQEDPGADFPLFMSDDREALFHISRTTGGCMWDKDLLEEAARTRVGHVAPDSPLAMDQYLGKLVRKHQPHMVRPNIVQWYTLFSLSPLSPTFHTHWGHLPPPAYLQHRLNLGSASDAGGGRSDVPQSQGAMFSIQPKGSLVPLAPADQEETQSKANLPGRLLILESRKPHVRVQFSTYFINPVRILGLLVMRVKEGYRAIRYGQSTNDADKVSIIFQLALELGTSLYYEVSYRSLPGHNHMVGHAHIKIEISGEASFVQAVKTDFLQHHSTGQRRPVTLAQQVSAKLGRLLRSIRREDLLQSYLSPIKWSEQLLKPDSPFIRRLGTLSEQQKVKHFRYDEFDCVCVGRMPYTQDTDFLDAFQDSDNGEEELLDAISSWATRRIDNDRRGRALSYVRKLGDGLDGLPCYCLLSVEKSPLAPRLFTISVEIFEGSSSAPRRLAVLGSLREILSRLEHVRVLEMQIGPFLMTSRSQHGTVGVDFPREKFLTSQYLHKSWDLVYDKELLFLLMRRRAELGGFWLLDSGESHALFARLHSKDGYAERKRNDPGDMVQYQVSILADRVVVDLYMESEIGVFRDSTYIESSKGGQFETLATNLRRRDQECGLALRARTQLLSIFDQDTSTQPSSESLLDPTARLLGYASRMEQRLTAFHETFVGANEMLLLEFQLLLLEQRFGVQIASLSINSTKEIHENDPGLWFVVNCKSQQEWLRTICVLFP